MKMKHDEVAIYKRKKKKRDELSISLEKRIDELEKEIKRLDKRIDELELSIGKDTDKKVKKSKILYER